ncbi:MAG: stage II sporulation protein M [Archangium sp.]
MELAEFVEQRRPKWDLLERLLDSAEREGLNKLSLDDARALSRLYRSASSDLLWVRARAGAAEVSGYLNDLVGRAYALTYPGKKVRWAAVWKFLSIGFPDTLAREWRMFVASFLLFWAGGGFGWIGMMFVPDAAAYLVPEQHQTLDPEKRREEEAKNQGANTGQQAHFSSFLFTHNIEVAFFCFALGLTAGIGTAYLLFYNGLGLGALAWVYTSKGMAGWFWAWILPHGIPEITAIVIAGAGGLIIGRAFIAPKGQSRRVALKREGKTALALLMGTLALFVLAGFIEGTISQIHPPRLSVLFKLSFALTVGSGVYAYLWSGALRKALLGARAES